jgi:hypothetical protein
MVIGWDYGLVVGAFRLIVNYFGLMVCDIMYNNTYVNYNQSLLFKLT